MSETTAAHEPEAADAPIDGNKPRKMGFRFDGITISVMLLVLAAAFIVWDLRDVIWLGQRQRAVISYIKQPGKRLTQVERELNAAGFQTLYQDEPAVRLQVSLMNQDPLLFRTLRSIDKRTGMFWHLFGVSRFSFVIKGRYLSVQADKMGLVPKRPLIFSSEWPELHSL